MIVTPALLLFADALVEVPPALSSFLLTRFNAPGTDLAVRCIVLLFWLLEMIDVNLFVRVCSRASASRPGQDICFNFHQENLYFHKSPQMVDTWK